MKRLTFFDPLKFHLEPPALFVELCFLGLLFPLFVLAVRSEDPRPVFQQLPFRGPNQVGMKLMFTRKLAYRLAAFNCFKGNAKLVACRVWSLFLDYETVSPRAWCSPPLYTSARGSVLEDKHKFLTMSDVTFVYKPNIVIERGPSRRQRVPPGCGRCRRHSRPMCRH